MRYRVRCYKYHPSGAVDLTATYMAANRDAANANVVLFSKNELADIFDVEAEWVAPDGEYAFWYTVGTVMRSETRPDLGYTFRY